MPSPKHDLRPTLVAALVASAEGDRTAFREVYRLTSAKLFGICLRICVDRQAAEDVLHEAYLTVWRRAGAFEPDRASPITWMATIVRNKAIDWRRAQGRVVAAPLSDEADAVVDPVPLADERVMDADETRRLFACLDALNPHSRDAIRTAFLDGASYPELAARAGVPLGTVKSWVRRGLAQLRRCLEE